MLPSVDHTVKISIEFSADLVTVTSVGVSREGNVHVLKRNHFILCFDIVASCQKKAKI